MIKSEIFGNYDRWLCSSTDTPYRFPQMFGKILTRSGPDIVVDQFSHF